MQISQTLHNRQTKPKLEISMEEFFEIYTTSGTMSWFEEAPQTAFQRYTNRPYEGQPAFHPNANKKMIDFLKKSWAAAPVPIEMREQEKYRSLKHKITERMRRKKHRQIYIALHELLPLGTKSHKNSILEMAAKEIEEVQQYKEELRRQNEEKEMILSAWKSEKRVEKAEIKLKVAFPTSGVDSMLEVLRCLKDTGCTATAIQSNFSQHEFAAAVEFETKMRAADVEKAVQRTLFETEMKFQHQL